jgi:quinol monooxygenase YgiN
VTHHGCVRRDISGREASSPGSPLPRATKFSRHSRRKRLVRARDEVCAIQVSWSVELEIRPGCVDDFEELTGEMVAAACAESGVLGYQRFIGDDGQTVDVQECYESSEAAAAHLGKFAAAFDQRFSAMVERKRFVVFGDPSDELRALSGIYRATYHRPFGSFAYWG